MSFYVYRYLDPRPRQPAASAQHLGRDVYNGKRNVHIRFSGNSRTAFIRRLRKDRPDIHARVLAGELSPHAGMIKAGFRKKPVPKQSPGATPQSTPLPPAKK
jgi:hypothetical protein